MAVHENAQRNELHGTFVVARAGSWTLNLATVGRLADKPSTYRLLRTPVFSVSKPELIIY